MILSNKLPNFSESEANRSKNKRRNDFEIVLCCHGFGRMVSSTPCIPSLEVVRHSNRQRFSALCLHLCDNNIRRAPRCGCDSVLTVISADSSDLFALGFSRAAGIATSSAAIASFARLGGCHAHSLSPSLRVHRCPLSTFFSPQLRACR